MKTASFLVYFKLIKYLHKRLAPPKSTALPVALRQATRLSLVSNNFNQQHQTINFKMLLKVLGLIIGPRKRTGGVHRHNMEKQNSFSIFFCLMQSSDLYKNSICYTALCEFAVKMPGYYQYITSIVVSHLTTLIYKNCEQPHTSRFQASSCLVTIRVSLSRIIRPGFVVQTAFSAKIKRIQSEPLITDILTHRS